MAGSGYTSCQCPDCFEIAISDDLDAPELCLACQEAGCDGEGECQAEGAYGYEPCGTCGFDHEYEPAEAQAAHTRVES